MHFKRAGVLTLTLVLAGAAIAPVLARAAGRLAQEQAPVQRHVEITAKKYAFVPDRIEVDQDDLVKVTLHSGDIAHSFAIDKYRIAKRVGPGQTVTFEFRADQAGTFPIYCSLRQDDGCRRMHGELIVRPRR